MWSTLMCLLLCVHVVVCYVCVVKNCTYVCNSHKGVNIRISNKKMMKTYVLSTVLRFWLLIFILDRLNRLHAIAICMCFILYGKPLVEIFQCKWVSEGVYMNEWIFLTAYFFRFFFFFSFFYRFEFNRMWKINNWGFLASFDLIATL